MRGSQREPSGAGPAAADAATRTSCVVRIDGVYNSSSGLQVCGSGCVVGERETELGGAGLLDPFLGVPAGEVTVSDVVTFLFMACEA